MSAIFIIKDRADHDVDAELRVAREQFGLHRFRDLKEFALPGWRILHAPQIFGGPNTRFAEGDDFVLVAGTLTFDGKMGREGLRRFLREADHARPDWSRLGGQFAVLVHKNGRTFLMTDYFAAFQVFHDRDHSVFSTSFLAAARTMPRLRFDRQGVYEFVFNVVPIGNDTVLDELKLVGPNVIVELDPYQAMPRPLIKDLPGSAAGSSIGDRLAEHKAALLGLTAHYVGEFGDRVYCPLSGGLDSRLLLAALRASNCRPNVYVYGSPDESDVEIALAIGKDQGFDVDAIDKETWRSVTPEQFPDQVEKNFQEYDALPNFGELFESGSNGAARDARHLGGAMSASGGCGEVFRNFFFLPNRRISARDVARTFFARYIRSDTTDVFDEDAFLENIENKILDALGQSGVRSALPRRLIEEIYPRVRCRSLFGREISLESRHGVYLMPFLDHRIVGLAMDLPQRLKNAGDFEGRLIDAISPALANLPSSYGHDFSGRPSLNHRFSEWTTRARPAWLRQQSYRIQRRLHPLADEHGGIFSSDYMDRVVDPGYPHMSHFFSVAQVADSSAKRRISCLEYLGNRLGVSP